MNNYKELKVWQRSMDLAGEIYSMTRNFPEGEKYGLKSQVQRSAVSIPSNIAEGSGRGSQKEFSNFISISIGSAYELETQIILSNKLNYVDEQRSQVILSQLEEIQKMLFGLKKSLIKDLQKQE